MAGSSRSIPRVFLLLGEEFKEPRWRQCLILKKARSGWIMMARADKAELAGLIGKVNTYEIGEKHYVLVEGSQQQVRSEEPQDGYLALEQNREMLIEKGQSLLAATDQDAMFATASEDLEETQPRPRSTVGPLAEAEEDSSSSATEVEDAETDAFLSKLLEKSKQNKPVSGGRSDKTASRTKTQKRSAKSRYPVLGNKQVAEDSDSSSRDKRAKGHSELKDLMRLVGKTGASVDPLQAIALQHIFGGEKDSATKRRPKRLRAAVRTAAGQASQRKACEVPQEPWPGTERTPRGCGRGQ